MRELGLGFTNPLETGGVLDMCLCFGCGGVGGVGGEWAWTRVDYNILKTKAKLEFFIVYPTSK